MTTEVLSQADSSPIAGIRLCYTPDRPLILFTDFPADAGGGANVIIRCLLTEEERRSILHVSPSPPASVETAERRPNCITLHAGSLGSSGGKKRSWLQDTLWYAGRLADEVMTIARDRQAAALWVVLHYAGVPVALRLAQRSGLPLHVGVNDDPPYGVALRSRRAFLLVPWFARMFARVLRAASSIDTTSAPMAERYLRRYGVHSVITHRGLAGPIRPNSAFDPDRGELSVGILGNVYGYSQLPVLGQAVTAAARQIGARPKLVVIGQRVGDRLRRDMSALGVDMDAPGHLAEADAVERLRTCLALYLNYPYGWRDRVMRRTSFPVKLSSYLLTTRPVLFHGPDDTSIEGPKRRAPDYIRHWNSMDFQDGVRILKDLWDAAPSAEKNWTAGAEAVRADYYDLDTYRRNLVGALNRLTQRENPPQ